MAPGAGTFGGELGLIGLFDLGQLLMLNRATGCLAVQREAAKGYLYFLDGQVVNAVDDEYHEGEAAAHRVFSWKSGRFEFRAEPPGGARTIQGSTEALMLEAARRLDEAGEAGGGETARLRERQGAMEALRDAFHDAARQARGTEGGPAPAGGPRFDALQSAEDRLVYRPGRPPRLFRDGRWQATPHVALDSAQYEELKAKLFAAAVPHGDAAGGGARAAVVRFQDGRAFAVTAVGGSETESLWIRPAALQPPHPALLEGPLEQLHALLDLPQGVLLAGGPTVQSANRLLHAIVAVLARRRGGTVLLIASDGTYRHPDDSGVVVCDAPGELGGMLRAAWPGTIAIEAACPADHPVFDALHTARFVLAGVVAADHPAMMPRWLAGLSAESRQRLAALLGAVPAGFVLTRAEAGNEGALPFATWAARRGSKAPVPLEAARSETPAGAYPKFLSQLGPKKEAA